MDTFWLILPYVLLLVINGAQLYMVEHGWGMLAEQCQGRLAQMLGQFRAAGVGWYWWLAREAKDWAVAGVLAIVVLHYADVEGNLARWLAGLLATALLLHTLLALVLLYCLSGAKVPRLLLLWSARAAIPDYRLANRRRMLYWGLLLLLAGLSALPAWVISGSTGALFFGFVSCLLGFYSLLWASSGKTKAAGGHAAKVVCSTPAPVSGAAADWPSS